MKTGRSQKTESVPETLGGSSGLRSKRGGEAEDREPEEDKVDSDQEIRRTS